MLEMRGLTDVNVMRTLLALFLSGFVLAPANLQAYYSVTEVDADALRKDSFIKVKLLRLGDQVTFFVALRSTSDRQDVYWNGALDLVDPQGVLLARVEMRGEDIRRSIDELILRKWDWKDFRPAEAFRFTVKSSMLVKSKFTWETGPRNDEHGSKYGGGIIRWSYLQAFADAAENANKLDAMNESQPIRSQTNQTSSAAIPSR